MFQPFFSAARSLFIQHSKIPKCFYASLSSYDIRKKFIDFYESNHDHEFIPSSSVHLPNDPSLNFVNAGMNQFKQKFLASVGPHEKLAKVERAVNSQKCIRAGGKHNDLEDVGHDTSHHTFFEMLGSWSFGNYFKDDACEMALELLVNHFKLPPDHLYFTYFSGYDPLSLEPDIQTRDIWKRLGIPEYRILPFGMEDNFWRMGETGPCGPCTEIHYDYAGQKNAASMVNEGHPDVVEIWNLVFMQFNCLPSGQLIHLPKNHVDTGMGLERITAVLQDKKSNYDTDLFVPIIGKIEEVCNCPRYSGQYTEADVAYRIISDHIRMIVVAISDNVYPGNVAAELTVRQVLRRAIKYGNETLSAPDGFLALLVPAVVKSLCGHYPILKDRQKEIMDIIEDEEKRFIKLLTKGEKIINKALSSLKADKEKFPVETAIMLHNHYGYPVDLMMKTIKERKLDFDIDAFESFREEQERLKEEGRTAVKEERTQALVTAVTVNDLATKNIPYTEDSLKHQCTRNQDRTYTFPSLTTKIVAIISEGGKVLGENCADLKPGQYCALVLEDTLFFPQKDGHASDIGVISCDENHNFEVTSVTCAGGYVFHHGICPEWDMSVGGQVTAQLDVVNRLACMRSHSAAHLLYHSLRDVLGNVTDHGSRIQADKIRMDFSGVVPTPQDVKMIWNSVLSQIRTDKSSLHYNVSDKNSNDKNVYSREMDEEFNDRKMPSSFCNERCVRNMGDIGDFVIISCKSQGAHKTRIQCLTGNLAEKSQAELREIQAQVHQSSKECHAVFDNDTVSVHQVEALKKVLGKLNYDINSALVSVPCKDEMKRTLQDLSKKLNKKARTLATIKSQKHLVNRK